MADFTKEDLVTIRRCLLVQARNAKEAGEVALFESDEENNPHRAASLQASRFWQEERARLSLIIARVDRRLSE